MALWVVRPSSNSILVSKNSFRDVENMVEGFLLSNWQGAFLFGNVVEMWQWVFFMFLHCVHINL